MADTFKSSTPEHRFRQQQLLAAFGEEALRADDLDSLLQRATQVCSEGMATNLCKILEYQPDTQLFLVCAGVGWNPGVVGAAMIGSDVASPAGFAFKTGQPVLSNHLEDEGRFRTPQLLADHGVKRAINVLIRTRAGDFGVLEADDREVGRFEEADVVFLQSFANLIGVAIDRHRTEIRLQNSLKRQELLGGELNHRIKNLFSVIVALISLASRENPEAEAAFKGLRQRILALSAAHDVSQGKTKGDRIAVHQLVGVLLRPYDDGNARLVASGPELDLAVDVVTPLGLILHELATNAVKYGALSRAGGSISLVWSNQVPTEFRIAWTETGGPSAETPEKEGFGTLLITNAARQLNGRYSCEFRPEGLKAELVFPI